MQAPIPPMTPQEIGEWGRKIIEVYMQWYNFFVTANLLIIGWFVSKDVKAQGRASLVPIARLFQILNLLGATSTGFVGFYVARDVQRYGALIHWAALSNALGLLGIAYVWGRLIPKGTNTR